MLATEIQKYTDDYSNVQDAILNEVERSTHLHTIAPQMLSGRVQGAFLTLMTSLLQARHVLEIGDVYRLWDDMSCARTLLFTGK